PGRPRRCSSQGGPFPAGGRPGWPAAASAAASPSTPAGSRSRPPVAADRRRGGSRARRALAALAGEGFHFEPAQAEHFTTANGWHVDDYTQPLPPEPPGPPAPGASFEVARRLMADYEFADPAIVRAVYATDSPLDRRDMLLEGRFWGLRFRFGARVGGLVDEEAAVDGRRLRRWGWSYRTLQGHLEMGQMDYEVRTWLDRAAGRLRIPRARAASR